MYLPADFWLNLTVRTVPYLAEKISTLRLSRPSLHSHIMNKLSIHRAFKMPFVHARKVYSRCESQTLIL